MRESNALVHYDVCVINVAKFAFDDFSQTVEVVQVMSPILPLDSMTNDIEVISCQAFS